MVNFVYFHALNLNRHRLIYTNAHAELLNINNVEFILDKSGGHHAAGGRQAAQMHMLNGLARSGSKHTAKATLMENGSPNGFL